MSTAGIGILINVGDLLDKPVRRVCARVKIEAVLERRTFAVVLEDICGIYSRSTAENCKEKVLKMHIDKSDSAE